MKHGTGDGSAAVFLFPLPVVLALFLLMLEHPGFPQALPDDHIARGQPST